MNGLFYYSEQMSNLIVGLYNSHSIQKSDNNRLNIKQFLECRLSCASLSELLPLCKDLDELLASPTVHV